MTETTTTNSNGEEHDDDDDDMIVQNVDQLPHVILRGRAANLSALRQTDLQATFFQEQFATLDNDDDPTPFLLLEPSLSAVVRVGTTSVAGEVFVTRMQVLFVASDQSEHDFAIGASCIVLHAMMEVPRLAVYLQLNEDADKNAQMGAGAVAFGNDVEDDENDDWAGASGPLEVTIQPVEKDDCQRLFDSLCKLVALHPTEDDEDDDGYNMGGGGDDDLIWAPAHASTVNSDRSEGATEAERDAMLERLDNLLVVREEFKIQEGQFDDADGEAHNTNGDSQ